MTSIQTVDRAELDGAIDPLVFRNTLGHFASGVTVVTGHDGVEPIGFTCQSFYSVSLEPALVSFSVMTTSTTYPRIRETGRFAVNVLASTQKEISNQFARKGTDKWAGVEWTPSRSGNPTLDGALIWVDCEIFEERAAGDHLIVIGRATELSAASAGPDEPLLFFKGDYHRLHQP